MSSLEKRIKRLEAASGASGGSEGCERCGDTTVVRVGDEIMSVSKRGHVFPHAAAVAFVAEEGPGGVCPVCGTHRRDLIRPGWPKPRQMV